MPGTIRFQCNRCSFQKQGIESGVAVILANGEQRHCPHPGDRFCATEATGETWENLVAQDRIRVMCGLLCLHCGHLDYYAALRVPSDSLRYVSDIYHRPSLEEARTHHCASCGSDELYPLCGPQSGCLQLILSALRLVTLREPRLSCPICKTGTLVSVLTEIA